VCEGSLARIGTNVFFSNPRSTSGRDHLSIRRSGDGGATWPAFLLVDPAITAGYSSLIKGMMAGNKSGILYESSGHGDIAFATFDPYFQ